ncbi:MAG TPA: hypothetical protein PLK30_26605 [Blastocatellia bacterium]|nr:hypothetical protein [Blastocatellia bacterium]
MFGDVEPGITSRIAKTSRLIIITIIIGGFVFKKAIIQKSRLTFVLPKSFALEEKKKHSYPLNFSGSAPDFPTLNLASSKSPTAICAKLPLTAGTSQKNCTKVWLFGHSKLVEDSFTEISNAPKDLDGSLAVFFASH